MATKNEKWEYTMQYITLKIDSAILNDNKQINRLFVENKKESKQTSKNFLSNLERIKVNIIIKEKQLPTVWNGSKFDKGNIIGDVVLQHSIYSNIFFELW